MKVKRFQIDMFILCFDQFLEEKLQLDRKRFVARKKQNQIRAQDVLGILKNIFLFDLDLFDKNPKWRPNDVIRETVNIDGSASNAIPDIPRPFNTSDRNILNIR